MNLNNLIYLYTILEGQEATERPTPLPQEIIKLMKPKLHAVSKPKVLPEITAEQYLEKRLVGFTDYMLEYSGV